MILMILILPRLMVEMRSRNRRMESSISTLETTINSQRSKKEAQILSIYLELQSSQFRLNSQLINLILDLHLRIMQREPTVNKTLYPHKIKQMTHFLQTSSLSKIQTYLKEFNSQLRKRKRQDSSPTPCSCKAAPKLHNSNTSNSCNSNSNNKQINTSSIRQHSRCNSNRIQIKCNMVLDSKDSNSQCRTKDNLGLPCHSMDNSNSSIIRMVCKETNSILEIITNSNNQCSNKISKNQLVHHLTFFEKLNHK